MPEVPEGSVVITPEQMWSQVHETFGRIDSRLERIGQEVHGLPAQVAEHDAYLNALRAAGLPERFAQAERDVAYLKGRIAWAFGAGAAACFVSGIVGAWVPHLLG